jgi:hypothetical protein
VVLVDDWADVTPDLLEKAYSELVRGCSAFKFEKLTKTYWLNLLRKPWLAYRPAFAADHANAPKHGHAHGHARPADANRMHFADPAAPDI